MLKPRTGFIKAEINVEKFTEKQWKAVLNGMESYAEHYFEEKIFDFAKFCVEAARKGNNYTAEKIVEAYINNLKSKRSS